MMNWAVLRVALDVAALVGPPPVPRTFALSGSFITPKLPNQTLAASPSSSDLCRIWVRDIRGDLLILGGFTCRQDLSSRITRKSKAALAEKYSSEKKSKR